MKLYETASTCSRADALQDMTLSHISPPITELRIMKPFFFADMFPARKIYATLAELAEGSGYALRTIELSWKYTGSEYPMTGITVKEI